MNGVKTSQVQEYYSENCRGKKNVPNIGGDCQVSISRQFRTVRCANVIEEVTRL